MKTWLIIFMLFPVLIHAQMHPYHTSDSILHHKYQDNKSRPDFETKAWQFSFIGDYKHALAMWDSAHLNESGKRLSPKDSLYFHRFSAVNAHDYIIERAKKERIIIINEAHHQPLHRAFLELLLPDLYKAGYRLMGTETMPYQADSLLNAQKYPVLMTGYYTVEPRFGNEVRTALQAGYYVFGYECVGNVTPTAREIQQAQHIKRFMDANPGAKIIIHCGFGHLLKTDLPGAWEKSMAQRLKEYTGIEPFCIDQVELTEKSSTAFDDPLYRSISLDYDAVFIDSSGNAYSGPDGGHNYNLQVYHPRTKWKNGRPLWVFGNGRKPFFIHGTSDFSYPCLVLAFHDGEDVDKGVPADIIELKSPEDKKALALEPGAYVIVFRDNYGLEQQFKTKLK